MSPITSLTGRQSPDAAAPFPDADRRGPDCVQAGVRGLAVELVFVVLALPRYGL